MSEHEIATPNERIEGTLVDVWRSPTRSGIGVRLDTGQHLTLADAERWAIIHRENGDAYSHDGAGNPLIPLTSVAQ